MAIAVRAFCFSAAGAGSLFIRSISSTPHLCAALLKKFADSYEISQLTAEQRAPLRPGRLESRRFVTAAHKHAEFAISISLPVRWGNA
jgi:hypothetical protein